MAKQKIEQSQVAVDFKKHFKLDFSKYRDEGWSFIKGRDMIDVQKFCDYLAKKYAYVGSMIECIRKEYGDEAGDWYEMTVFGKIRK